ncbi:hypothetical protein ACHAXT_011874 [Thalassiosira profunda]
MPAARKGPPRRRRRSGTMRAARWFGPLAVACGACVAHAVDGTAAADAGSNNGGVHHTIQSPRRELIAHDEDVAARLRIGATRHYDIEAESDDADDDHAPLLLHVDQVVSAVTSATTFQFHPRRQFRSRSIGDIATLCSGRSSVSPAEGNGEFTLMSVDKLSGDVAGLQRDGKGGTRTISSEGTRVKVRSVEHTARNFTCGAEHADLHNHDHDHEHYEHEQELFDGRVRGLVNDYHEERQFKVFDPDDHHLHRADHSRKRPKFVINLLVLVDASFVDRQGNARAAVRYVDFLISAANAIFDEVDARLNVVRMEETDIFQSREVKTLRDGLRIMRQQYKGIMGTDEVDLVHAMLGEDMGGGIAFIDSVCDDLWGVGLSSGLRGVVRNLDDEAMNDAFVVAHELGHSLGSGHTFDGYTPPVDTCGFDECPRGLQKKSATLMSYCNFCEGGTDNVALTLGGVFSGRGSKMDVANWEVSPVLADAGVSTDPQRVSHTIYKRLAGKGQCINPALRPTVEPTAAPTAGPTRPPSHYPYIPDGRRWVQPARHCLDEQNCAAASGVMFDLEHPEGPNAHGVFVEALQFEHMNRPNQTVDVYTTINGSYVGIEQLSDQWEKVASVVEEDAQSYSEVVLGEAITIPPGGKRGFYLVTGSEEAYFLVGSGSSAVNASDVSFRGGEVVFDTFGMTAPNFYPIVQAGVTMALPPSLSPTSSPTAPPSVSPTTAAPSMAPIMSPTASPIMSNGPFFLGPENRCEKDCSAAPGYMFSAKNNKKGRREVTITGVSFEHLMPKQNRFVEVYRTISGPYSGKEQNPQMWDQIASSKMTGQNKLNVIEIVFDVPIKLMRGEMVSFYLKTEENIFLLAKNKGGVDIPTSDGRLQLACGSAIMNGAFGAPTEGFSWNGEVTYSTAFV